MAKGAAWVRSAGKEQVSTGNWTTGKKMPKTTFPLRSNQSYRLAGTWTWRLISFVVGTDQYRVLLAHKAEKQEFMAMLGHLVGRDMTVLCRIEHHGSHPGWHIHYQPFETKQSGVVIGVDARKRPCGRDSRFGTDVLSGFDDWAISVAHSLFNLPHARGDSDEPLL